MDDHPRHSPATRTTTAVVGVFLALLLVSFFSLPSSSFSTVVNLVFWLAVIGLAVRSTVRAKRSSESRGAETSRGNGLEQDDRQATAPASRPQLTKRVPSRSTNRTSGDEGGLFGDDDFAESLGRAAARMVYRRAARSRAQWQPPIDSELSAPSPVPASAAAPSAHSFDAGHVATRQPGVGDLTAGHPGVGEDTADAHPTAPPSPERLDPRKLEAGPAEPASSGADPSGTGPSRTDPSGTGAHWGSSLSQSCLTASSSLLTPRPPSSLVNGSRTPSALSQPQD